jgi:hypothetical protein
MDHQKKHATVSQTQAASGAQRAQAWLVAVGFLILVSALRFTTLFQMELSPDDSNFLMLGRTILRGGTPYVDWWDHHPLMGGALFALTQVVLGPSVLAIRILTIIAVSLECFLLYRLGCVLGRRDPVAGLVAALVYAVFSINMGGLAADRILFFAPLITLAMYVILARGEPDGNSGRSIGYRRLLFAGLLLGIGLELKYSLAVEAVSVAVIVASELFLAFREEPKRYVVQLIKAWSALAVGPVVIMLGVAGSFAAGGHWQEFLYANFEAGVRYAAGTSWSSRRLMRSLIFQISTNTIAWLSLAWAPIYILFARDVERREKRHILYVIIWFICAFGGICLTKRFDAHYFLQVLPALSTLTGLAVAGTLRTRYSPTAPRVLALAFIIVASLFSTIYNPLVSTAGALFRHLVAGQPWPQDPSGPIAEYLRARVGRDQTVYIFDYSPVVYYAADVQPATKYIMPVHLIDEWYQPVIGRDQIQELDAILARRPMYVLTQSPPSRELTNLDLNKRLQEHLAADYILERVMPGIDTYTRAAVNVELYRRKNPEGQQQP